MRTENLEKLLKNLEHKQEKIVERVNPTIYFRENFEAIERLIELNNMSEVNAITNKPSYKFIADVVFEFNVMQLNGKPLSLFQVGNLLLKIRKEREYGTQ